MSYAFENVQNLERGDPLAVGRQFPDVVAAIIGRNWLDPVGRVILEVLHAEIAAVRLAEGDDLLGDRAAVIGIAAAVGDHAQAVRQVRVAEDLAHLRGPAVGIIRGGRFGIVGRDAFARLPIAGDDLADRKTLFGILNRWGQQLRELHRAEPLTATGPSRRRNRGPTTTEHLRPE